MTNERRALSRAGTWLPITLAAVSLAACGSEPTGTPRAQQGPLQFSFATPLSPYSHCSGEVPVSLTVTDANDDPVAGVLVNFHVTRGGGSFFAGSGLTSAEGLVKDYWTMGKVPNDSNTFEARAVDPVTGEKHVYVTQSTTTLTRIVFRSHRDGNWEIYAMDPDGANVTRLTNDPGADLEPAWSPDGTRIVFSSNRDGDHEIYTMKGDGSDLQQVTFNTVEDQEPVWSPTGSYVAFQSNRTGDYEIFSVLLSTGEVFRHTTHPGVDIRRRSRQTGGWPG